MEQPKTDAKPDGAASAVERLVMQLRMQAIEIATAGHKGWGNTMNDAAHELEVQSYWGARWESEHIKNAKLREENMKLKAGLIRARNQLFPGTDQEEVINREYA